jgi:branched-chain amino acid aminotransferase
VIDLAKRRGIDVIERRILPDELPGFDECFITGTAAEVTPVAEIGPHSYTPGTITRALIEDYTAEVKPKARAAA